MDDTGQLARRLGRGPALPAHTVGGLIRSPGPSHKDDLEWTLEAVGLLVGRALDARREKQRCEPPPATPPPTTADANETVPPLAGLIRLVGARPTRLSVSWHSWADRGRVEPELLGLLQAALAAGGTVRIVADEHCAGEEPSVGHLQAMAGLGAQVRVHNSALPDLVVLGRDVAVLRSTDAGYGLNSRHLAVQRGTAAGMEKLISAAWANAADLAVHQRMQADRRGVPDSVLTMLSEGCKDDVAARRLNISLRTYRRHVADLMRHLDAASRFQAGLQAARLTGRIAENEPLAR